MSSTEAASAGGHGVTAEQLAAQLVADDELAVLEVRETDAVRRDGTLLLAAHVPLGELEQRVAALVPRRGTPVVVVDGDGGPLAREAVRLLHGLGYHAAAPLLGGAAAWGASGRELYTSEIAFARAFGAWVGERHRTPTLHADELAELLASGADVVLLDSRPAVELADHAIPGAVSAPGAELLDRGLELIGSPETTVVVTCAARTRGILGTQALVNAGLPNQVRMLAGGTMAWWSAAQPLVAGERPQAPPRSAARTAARAGAVATLRARFGLRTPLAFARWSPPATGAARTTYVLDVRSPEEHAAGRVPGSRSAPSWELVPRALTFVPTLRAAIVLVDDAPGLRGLVTASWLLQMGWRDVQVVTLSPDDAPRLERATGEPASPQPPHGTPWQADDRATAFAAYLDWERAACEQLRRDETVPFRVL